MSRRTRRCLRRSRRGRSRLLSSGRLLGVEEVALKIRCRLPTVSLQIPDRKILNRRVRRERNAEFAEKGTGKSPRKGTQSSRRKAPESRRERARRVRGERPRGESAEKGYAEFSERGDREFSHKRYRYVAFTKNWRPSLMKPSGVVSRPVGVGSRRRSRFCRLLLYPT